VVDDQQVCGLRCGSGEVKWACATGSPKAGFGGAGIVLGGKVQPYVALRIPVQVDAAAVSAVVVELPDQQLCQDANLSLVSRSKTPCILEPPRAEVICASLKDRSADFKAERLLQVGDILPNQLILQIDCVGG
jgi:hypothetical protein